MSGRALVHSVKSDPIGSLKVVLFIGIVILVLFVLYKFLKGIGRVGDVIGDLAPHSEADKAEIVGSATYQDGVKWLEQIAGISAIVKAGYGKPSEYLTKKNISYDTLGKVSQQIWAAKIPGYISSTEVYNAIESLPSKAAISLMSGVFNQIYQKSIGYYPLNVFLGKYLTVTEMKTLTGLISKKPEV